MTAVCGRFIHDAPAEAVGHCLGLLIHPPDMSELVRRVPAAAFIFMDPYQKCAGGPAGLLEEDIPEGFSEWFDACVLLRYAETTDLVYRAFMDGREGWAPVLAYIADTGNPECLPWLDKLLGVAGGIDGMTPEQQVLFGKANDLIERSMTAISPDRSHQHYYQDLRRLIGKE